jgi:hypothetical protein
MNYRWLLVIVGLAIVVSILLVYAENRVYQPSTPFTGGTGDHVHAFVIDPFNARHIYLGTHYGFFRSNDGGSSWTRLSGAGGIPQTLIVTSLSLSPIDSGTVYATGYDLDSGNALGFFRTTDDGARWQNLPTGGTGELPNPRVLFVAAGWALPGEAYAYSIDDGLYRSTDGGAHWEQVAQPFAGQVTAFVPVLDCSGVSGQTAMTGTACPERLLVGTTQGLYIGTAASTGAIAFTAVPAVSSYVYSVAVHRGPAPAISASTTQGVFRASSPEAAFTQIDSVASGAPTLTSLAASGPDAAMLFGVTTQNVVVTSKDSGASWQAAGASLLTRDVSQLTSGLRQATGSNTPQWAGGQNIFLTVIQTPVGSAAGVYAAISFPVQLFYSADAGQNWSDLNNGG